MSTNVSKIVAERNYRILAELVAKPGNDICADCRARAPRWASYNLGIFVCVNCASVHRKIGTHISKVKSITMDQWTKEQIEVMKERGNIKSNMLYNPDEARNPPPTNMADSERDSELEKYIRSKYEFKRFVNRKSIHRSQQPVTDPSVASTALRSWSTPQTDPAQVERETSLGPPPPPKTPENLPPRLHLLATVPSPSGSVSPLRSLSQPLPPQSNSDKITTAPPPRRMEQMQPSTQNPAGQAWEDLISLQGPSQSFSLPLQYSSIDPTTSFSSQPQVPLQQRPTTPNNAPRPFVNLALSQVNMTTPPVASPISATTLSIPQFPFVPYMPLFSTNPNAFSPSSLPVPITTSTIPAPPVQPVMTDPTGAPLHTPPILDVPLRTFTPTAVLSFPPTPFSAVPASIAPGIAQSPFAPVGAAGQVPLSTSELMNPYSTMRMGQGGFPAATPQTTPETTAFLGQQQTQQLQTQQQQQPRLEPTQGFSGWAGQGV